MAASISVGIVAPSAVVPPIELKMGVERLESLDFNVRVHAQVAQRHLFFAGDDRERAEAFFEYAMDPSVDVLWAARGGYGAFRILPYLDRMTAWLGTPPRRKLLVGYSDATALMEYVRRRWNWSTLHAPMPGLREFGGMASAELKRIAAFVSGKRDVAVGTKLKLLSWGRQKTVTGQLVGGNLSVWVSMLGTRFAGNVNGKILFLEDVSEALYRVDRLVQQLVTSDEFHLVKGIVLGTFHDCDDLVPNVLKKRIARGGRKVELRPLRPRISRGQGLKEIFVPIAEHFKIPLAIGLKAGHGGGHAPLPLGAIYTLDTSGNLEMTHWDWKAR